MAKWWAAGFAVVGFGVVSTIVMLAAQNTAPTPTKKATPPTKGTARAKSEQAWTPVQATTKDSEPAGRPKPAPPVLPTPRFGDPSPAASAPRRLTPEEDSLSARPSMPTSVRPAIPTTKIRREGAELVDVVGTIRRQGNRLEFAPADGSAPMTILENQLLQRIDQSAAASGGGRPWTVSGTVTEYRNINYLLLSRAFSNR
jgi:hypothetical protein